MLLAQVMEFLSKNLKNNYKKEGLMMSRTQKRIYSLYEFMSKYKFIPKPVIAKEHKWMIDEYIWYCVKCDLIISKPVEIRKEIFDKAFPISVSEKDITYIYHDTYV